MKSLETESQSEAEFRVLSVVSTWKAEFERARASIAGNNDALALNWQADYVLNKDMYLTEIYDDLIDDRAREIAVDDKEAAKTFQLIATGASFAFADHLEEWLAYQSIAAKTIDMRRSDIKRIAKQFPYAHEINLRAVRRYADDLQSKENLHRKTVTRIINTGKLYWTFLDRRGYIQRDDKPFTDVVSREARSTKASVQVVRQPFPEQDMAVLVKAAEEKGDLILRDLIVVAMWTGCRIEEICGLKLSNVGEEALTIVDAKTEAGNRDVPIHSKLKPTIDRLKTASKDGYLLSGLTVNKYGDRSNAIGKRFGRMKSALGYGPEYVFHSIRKTMATQLENAAVLENISSDILGHYKNTVTYGLYSGGIGLSTKREAIEKVSYSSF